MLIFRNKSQQSAALIGVGPCECLSSHEFFRSPQDINSSVDARASFKRTSAKTEIESYESCSSSNDRTQESRMLFAATSVATSQERLAFIR